MQPYWLGIGIFLLIGLYLIAWNQTDSNDTGLPNSWETTDFQRRSQSNFLALVVMLALVLLLNFEVSAGMLGIFPSASAAIQQALKIASWLLYAYALLFTLSAIFLVLFFSMTQFDRTPDALQLAKDTFVSVGLNLLATAVIYKDLGISGPGAGSPEFSDWNYLYFSAVTFSTLGYGDFSPAPTARIIASFQAILGNLHLGIIAGTVLVALRGPIAPQKGQ